MYFIKKDLKLKEIQYFNEKLNVITHLKNCQPCIEKIRELQMLQSNYNREKAMILCSNIILEHKQEFEQITKLMHGKNEVVYGEVHELYDNKLQKNDNDLEFDIQFIIEALVLIYAVKCGIEDSLKSGLMKIKKEYDELCDKD